MEYMFPGCEYLSELDLSHFNTRRVQNMESMFNGCTYLETIYASHSWRTDAVTESNGMFAGCANLVGGQGTAYDEHHVDAARAHIDGGTSNPGYLTGKIVTQPGDVNADGEVNIADVNCLTDVIQGDSDTYEGRADVNSDGEVTIADINTVIDIILGGSTPPPPVPIPEYVDLGLPSGTLWATCNVGADSPEEYGDYFAWGETEPKDYYSWITYKWSNGEYNITKYSTTVDNKTELDPEDDAAYVNCGPQWRMPTMEQQQELIENCTWTSHTLNGVKGRLVTGPNGNSIFLPSAGSRYYDNDPVDDELEAGEYWSRTVGPHSSINAYHLNFSFSSASCYDSYRWQGFSVRAVRVP